MRTLTAGTRLVVASHNPGKIREFRALLAPFRIEVISAGELGLPEPEETGDTFAENARIKALAAAIAAQLPALSDDSGLEVAALDGAPGVVSARWAGPGKDFGAAMARVEHELQSKGAGIASSTNSSPGVVAAVGGAVARKEVGGAVVKKESGGAVAKKESGGAVASRRNNLSDTVNRSLALLGEGHDADAIAAERGITPSTVYGHFAEAIEAGLIEARSVLSLEEAEIDEILATFERLQTLETGKLSPAHAALDGRYDYGVLKCLLAELA